MERDKQLQEGEAKDEHWSYVHWQHQRTSSDATVKKRYLVVQTSAQATASSATVRLVCSVVDFLSVCGDFEVVGY